MTKKEREVDCLKEVVANKESLIVGANKVKKDMESNYSKAKCKATGKTPLTGAKHIIWDQLSVEINKFRECLNLIDDEHTLIKSSSQICG